MAVSASSSVQQARQLIADRLREIREQAGLTGRTHAGLCGWDPAKTSRIEHNRASPSVEDVRIWCRVCGVDDQTDGLVESLCTVEGMFVEWRRMERSGLRSAQEAIGPLYQHTRKFRAYSSWLVPGMVQTPGYTEAMLRSIQTVRSLVDDVDRALEVRIQRQRWLQDAGKTFAFVVEESVLRSGVMSAEVMAEQIRHLMDVATMPNVSLGIVAARFNRQRWAVEDFWIYDTAQVNVELVSGYLTLTQQHEIAMYAEVFAQQAELAVYGKDARELLGALAGGLPRSA